MSICRMNPPPYLSPRPPPSPVALHHLLPKPMSWSDLALTRQSRYLQELRFLEDCVLNERHYCQTLLFLVEDLLHVDLDRSPLAGELMFRTSLGSNYWDATPGPERGAECATSNNEPTARLPAPTAFQNVPTQLALANLLRAQKGQPALPIPFSSVAGHKRGRLGMYMPDLDQHFRWGFHFGVRGYWIMTWVCEVKVVGISKNSDGKLLQNRSLTHDRDWDDSRSGDEPTEYEGSESEMSSHAGESPDDQWSRVFRRQFGRQWAAGTAKLVTYLLSVHEFCGAYCGSTVIHHRTARFVVVNEEPLTIAVECTQEVLERLDSVLLMSDFIADRNNSEHMPTLLVSKDYRSFDADGLQRFLHFIYAARSVWAPMTDRQATSTVRLSPPNLDTLPFISDVRQQAKDYKLIPSDNTKKAGSTATADQPRLETSNDGANRGGASRGSAAYREVGADGRSGAPGGTNEVSSVAPRSERKRRASDDDEQTAKRSQTGTDARPRLSNPPSESGGIMAWAAAVSAAHAQPPAVSDYEYNPATGNTRGEAGNVIDNPGDDGTEQDSDEEFGDDNDSDDGNVHISTRDLLQLIREARVLCAPVSVQQMDLIVRRMVDV